MSVSAGVYFRLKAIRRQVEIREKLLADKTELKKAQRLEESGKTRRLNRKKYEEPEEDVLLTSELKGSLRLTRVCIYVSLLCIHICIYIYCISLYLNLGYSAQPGVQYS